MQRITLLAATLSLCACAHEMQTPPAHPVSQDEITAAKVPTTNESPYGPADYSFGSTLSSDGTPSRGNLYPGTAEGNRPNWEKVPVAPNGNGAGPNAPPRGPTSNPDDK